MGQIKAGVDSVAFAIVMPNILTALQIFYPLMSVFPAAPLFLGLFCRKVSSNGAIFSAVGGITVALFLQLGNDGKGIRIPNTTSTGILFSFVIMIVSIFIIPATKAGQAQFCV